MMHKATLACLSLLPPLAQAAIPPDIDRAFSHYTQLAADLAPVLEKATDRQSADQAAPELANLLLKVCDARTELAGIQDLPPEISAEVVHKYEATMRRNWGKVYEQIFRLQKNNCYNSAAFSRNFRLLCMILSK